MIQFNNVLDLDLINYLIVLASTKTRNIDLRTKLHIFNHKINFTLIHTMHQIAFCNLLLEIFQTAPQNSGSLTFLKFKRS